MRLELAYNKIDNLCCTAVNKYNDLFEEAEQYPDDNLCEDAEELIAALDTFEKLVNLEKEIGCPLEVRCKLCSDMKVYIIDSGELTYAYIDEINGDEIIITKPEWNNEHADYTNVKCLPYSEYKKSWWLKADRSK